MEIIIAAQYNRMKAEKEFGFIKRRSSEIQERRDFVIFDYLDIIIKNKEEVKT